MKLKTGDKINAQTANWSFKGNVVKSFDAHIGKSVPLYKETHNLYLYLSDFFLQNNSKIIDVGCSTGAFLKSLKRRHINNKKKITYIGIDTVSEMIRHAKKNNTGIKFLMKDVLKYNLKNSSIISSFYTLQFISPKHRQEVINKIYNSLNWGGAFFFIEKVRAPDARFQDYLNQVYLEYKISQGYSSDEIINKSKSLKGILEPFSSEGNLGILKRAGFKDIITVFKYACFEGFLAIK